MVEKTTKQVISLIEERGAMGLAIEILKTSPVIRNKENYQRLKEKMLLFPSGIIGTTELQQLLEQLLAPEEMMFVTFKKIKKNGKIGHKKEYGKGFCYYIGTNPDKLSKVYVHWKEEKKFLFKNIACLKNNLFWVEKSSITCILNVFCLSIFLFNPEKKKMLEGEISLYVGYAGPTE